MSEPAGKVRLTHTWQLRQKWTNLSPKQEMVRDFDHHVRHKLGLEEVVFILEVSGVELTEMQLQDLRSVLNDARINAHLVLSRGANVSKTGTDSTNGRIVCDTGAVRKCRDGLFAGKRVILSAHEAAHINSQIEVVSILAHSVRGWSKRY